MSDRTPNMRWIDITKRPNCCATCRFRQEENFVGRLDPKYICEYDPQEPIFAFTICDHFERK
ncbi:hypothetical protein M0R19_04900 [Candidatus Pacearchaeota archaeon]|jgi:hypothetical protein|nr:hypothetical protein [Candidatus Pacearchaeota archaeon]